jgi:hypothetical protein
LAAAIRTYLAELRLSLLKTSSVHVELAALGCYPSRTVLDLIFIALNSLLTGLRGHAAMQAEIIALRHQLTVLQCNPKPKRIRLNDIDRRLWAWLSFLWSGWRSASIMVQPRLWFNRTQSSDGIGKDSGGIALEGPPWTIWTSASSERNSRFHSNHES